MLSAFLFLFWILLDTISPRHDAIYRPAPCRGVVFAAILSDLLFIRIRRDHGPDRGSVIGVLRNTDLHVPQALEVLDDLAALEEFGQTADENVILDTGVHGG